METIEKDGKSSEELIEEYSQRVFGKPAKEIKYVLATNYIHQQLLQEELARTGLYQWLNVFKGDVKYPRDIKDYNDYDIVQVNMAAQDVHLIANIREQINPNGKTKLVVNNDYTQETWGKAFDYVTTLEREISGADMYFGTEYFQTTTLSELTGRRCFVIPHPADIKRLKSLPEIPKKNIISTIWRRYDNFSYIPHFAVRNHGLTTQLIGYDPKVDPRQFLTSTLYDYVLLGTNYFEFCFPSGTKIITENGYENIEEIEEDTKVLTYNGYKKVSKTYERHVDYKNGEEVFEVNPKGRQPFKVTLNHPFKTENGDFKTIDNIKYLRKDKRKLNGKMYIDLRQEFENIEDKFDNGKSVYVTDDLYIWLRKGRYNTKIPYTIELNEDFGYLVGAYCAEGSGTDYGIQFTLCNNNEPLLPELTNKFKKVFGIDLSTSYNSECNTINYYKRSKILRKIFKIFVEGNATTKKLTKYAFDNKKFLKGFISGLFKGDGYISKKEISLSTTSEELALQVCDILELFNIYGSHYKSLRKDKKTFIQNREVTYNSDLNTVRVMHPLYYNKFIDLFWIEGKYKQEGRQPSFKNTREQWFDNFVLIPFKKKAIQYTGNVYNLEVEDVNEYSLNSATVHNCDQMRSSKIVYDPFTYHSFSRATIDTAALGVPVVGSNRTQSAQICYPHTTIDPYDTKSARELIQRLLNDEEFYKKVVETAKEKSEYYNHTNSKVRYLRALSESLDDNKKREARFVSKTTFDRSVGEDFNQAHAKGLVRKDAN